MPFQLPTGLLNAGAGIGSNNFQLPSGLNQGGLFRSATQTYPTVEQFQQNAVQGFSDNINNIDYSSFDWKNPNSNPIEQFLNGDELPDPSIRIKTKIVFDPESGQLVAVPFTDEYDQLYTPTQNGQHEYYDVGEPGRIDTFKLMEKDEVSQVPGYIPGEDFSSGNKEYIYRSDPIVDWNPVESGQSGYNVPRTGADGGKMPRYVNGYVRGVMPYEGDIDAKPTTDIYAEAFNPVINDYVDYLNSNLTPEQLAAAFESGINPLDINYRIQNWNPADALLGGDGGMGTIPTRMMGSMEDWAGSLYENAGIDFNPVPVNQFQLPSGLTDLSEINRFKYGS